MALRSHEVVVSGHPRRSLCFVLTVFAVLSGCNCQKKGGTPTIVGSGGEPITVSTLDFGFVAVGQKLQLPLPLRNGGAGVLDIGEQFIDGGAVSSYSQPVPFATAIAAGGSDSSAIEFTPQDAGLLTSALTIQTDGTPAEKVVMLTGTGLDINVAASPSSLNFGSVQVDVMPPPTLQVTFTNNGSQPAQLTVDPSATYTDGGTAPAAPTWSRWLSSRTRSATSPPASRSRPAPTPRPVSPARPSASTAWASRVCSASRPIPSALRTCPPATPSRSR